MPQQESSVQILSRQVLSQRLNNLPSTPKVSSSLEDITVVPKPAQPAPPRFKDLDQQRVSKAWTEAPKPQELSSRAIRLEGPGRAVVSLEAGVMEQVFEKHKASILAFMRDSLENDLFDLDYEIVSQPDEPREVTPADRFAELAQRHTALIDLVKILDLKMI